MSKKNDVKVEHNSPELDQQLDEALEETFPGSDALSINQPAPRANDKDSRPATDRYPAS